MNAERLFVFQINGKVELLSLEEASKIDDSSVRFRVKEIIENSKNKRMQKDGFEPGWQENIQEHVVNRSDYNRILKEKGLIELGYDYVPKDSSKVGGLADTFTEETAKEIGLDLNENEINAIKSGEYFKDGACDLSDE